MLKKVTDLVSNDFTKGLATFSNIFSLTKEQSPNMMDCFIHFDGSVHKRRGSVLQNQVRLTSSGAVGFSVDSGGTLDENISAYWNLNEASGDRADFFSTHILESIGNVTKEGGILGNAAKFVATDTQYLVHLNTSTLATGDVDFSISSWFYLDSTGTTKTIIAKRDSGLTVGSGTILLMHMDSTNTFRDYSTANLGTASTTGTVGVDTLNKVYGTAAASFGGSTNYIEFPHSNLFNFGAGEFAIELNVYMENSSNLATFVDHGGGRGWFFRHNPTTQRLDFLWNDGTGLFSYSAPWNPPSSDFTHIVVQRTGNTLQFFQDGAQIGSDGSMAGVTIQSTSQVLTIGALYAGTDNSLAVFDELRISRKARYGSSGFTALNKQFGESEFEYWLSVDSNNKAVFSVSSDGNNINGEVRANSFGTLSTATWYHAVAWHDTGNVIGLAINLTADTVAYSSGIRSGSAGFSIGAISDGATSVMNGRIDETGFWRKVLSAQERSDLYNQGESNRFADAFEPYTWGAFDFGASDKRWLVVAAGTGLYASSNLGVNFTAFGTSQTSTWHNFERSKSVLIVTTDQYDTPLQWDGSGGTFASVLNVSAPTVKYAINHQGFLILLNSETRKRLFAYEDVNTQLTGDWGDNFDLPSSQDDEITGAAVLRRNLYVSTRFKVYRVSYVGGNPDWSFTEIKDWGFVPRTIQKMSLKDIGEVIIGLDWNRRLRLFDGADDKIISDNVELDNGMCDFAMEKISFEGSGLLNCHAIVDQDSQTYRLNVVIGENSTNTTHVLNFDGRNLSFYPYQNQPWQTMVVAQSNNRQFLLAGNRSSQIYVLDTSNLDQGTTTIDDIFDSPFLYDKSPSEVSKSFKADLYFGPTSSNTMYYMDRTDFSDEFKIRQKFNIVDTGGLVQLKKSIDVPVSQNVYQYRLTSSMGTSEPWELNRVENFIDGKGIGNNP